MAIGPRPPALVGAAATTREEFCGRELGIDRDGAFRTA